MTTTELNEQVIDMCLDYLENEGVSIEKVADTMFALCNSIVALAKVCGESTTIILDVIEPYLERMAARTSNKN